MNIICKKYVNMIKEKYSDIIDTIIIYGSNIYEGNLSDLDVCIIVQNITHREKRNIINDTIKFHLNNGLKLDEEIPFSNKLVYSLNDIDNAITDSPFYDNGKILINRIKKTKSFLNSEEMKNRLIINILTTDHVVIGKSVSEYEKRAFKMIIDVIINYFKLSNPNVDDILRHMYKNEYTGDEGEMFLGYKTNHPDKEKYLVKKIMECL